MHRTINVTIRDKIAVAEKDALYICGNSNFVIAFDFDDEWAGYEYKTARFVFNDTFADVVFSGNECAVPVLSNTYNFIVGVYAGDLCTTTPAYVAAKKSILCDSGKPADSFGDAYAQLIKVFNQTMEGVGSISVCVLNAETSAKNASASETNAKKSAEDAAASAKEVSDKAPIDSPVFTGSISMGRADDVCDETVALGVLCKATRSGAVALGAGSEATAFAAVALGGGYAKGAFSYAINGGEAKGSYSYAEGVGAIAYGDHQHVQGMNNIGDPEGKYIHIVGNGKGTRSNAHTLDWDGNAWFAGTVEGTALILLSPGGKRFKITVDDNGTLSTKELTE